MSSPEKRDRWRICRRLGKLSLERKKSKDVIVDNSSSQIGESLGQEADIRTNRSEITIICKYVHEITTKENVREALDAVFANVWTSYIFRARELGSIVVLGIHGYHSN